MITPTKSKAESRCAWVMVQFENPIPRKWVDAFKSNLHAASSSKSAIPPTGVGGQFKSNLQRNRITGILRLATGPAHNFFNEKLSSQRRPKMGQVDSLHCPR